MMRRSPPAARPLVLDPRGPGVTPSDNPWVLWQSFRTSSPFTCTNCGQEQIGERYLELRGTEPQIFPVLPRNPAHLEQVTSRVGRRQLCPACRWAKPVLAEQPKRRKRTLD
jgi:hypothetical protein